MDDGVNKDNHKNVKMGASSNPNSAKIASLQDRKKTIEETLNKHNQELRQLCIKEAELTGIMPVEYPLEPGETPPSIRRRVGTSFQLPQNVLNNINSEEEISALEVEMQLLAKMAEAALGLANDNNTNKTVRRTHMSEYQAHKQKYNMLEEKLHCLKMQINLPAKQPPQHQQQQPTLPSPNINHQLKQKKKPRPQEQDDSVSMSVNLNEPFVKSSFRHSLRSLQHPPIHQTQENVDIRYSHQKLSYKGSDNTSLNESVHQNYEQPIPSFYRLNFNSYRDYVNRQENETINFMQTRPNSQIYKPQQFVTSPSRTLPHSRRSPQAISQAYSYQDFNKFNNNLQQFDGNSHREASPSGSSNSSLKYDYYMFNGQQPNYKPYHQGPEHNFRPNPHQIQPHQQYDQDVMTSGGLGGYWKYSENGETYWCNASTVENQNDKKFGSLDRRKKRLQKRVSPNVAADSKSATLSVVPNYHRDATCRTLPSKSQQVVNRHRHDNRQLVRTQSLGSVGGNQIIDSVCPSDDSSCGSETLSFNEHGNHIRKHKQKEWFETSLDGPAHTSPPPPPPQTSTHSNIPPITPEEKYNEYARPLAPSPHTPVQTTFNNVTTPQSPKEIPAETNPISRMHEANIEIFNNNIPKNGTVVQHAQWKPYHEETKPFEMSDFYKYSTKFKKANPSPKNEEASQLQPGVSFRNLPVSTKPRNALSFSEPPPAEDDNVIQKGIYQPLQPMTCQAYNTPVNVGSPHSLNSSFDLNSSANVAENFSKEMNAWYQNHEHKTDNNNATLV